MTFLGRFRGLSCLNRLAADWGADDRACRTAGVNPAARHVNPAARLLAVVLLAAVPAAALATTPPGKSAGSGTSKSPGTTKPGMSSRNPLLDRTFPGEDYLLAREILDQGEYDDALKGFKHTWNRAVRDVDGRWIDSVCHFTMMGECFYKLGRTREALEMYTEAVKLFVAYRDWRLRVQFTDIGPSNRSTVTQPIPWGRSTRKSRPGHVAEKMTIGVGQIDQSDVVRRGGVARLPSLRTIRAAEISRATAVAISRRREILGPLSKHDPLTADLVKAFNSPLAPLRHWSEAWVHLEMGLAYAANEQSTQAIEALKKALVTGGQFDHPLTCVALLELGKLHFELGKFDEAAALFEEAGYSAYFYEDEQTLEEAIRLGTITHLVGNKRDLYPPLKTMIPWARQKRHREAEVSARLNMAENLAVLGSKKEAKEALADARLAIGNRAMNASRMSARLDYLTALVHYQSNNRRDGDKALEAAVKFQRPASVHLLQIALADKVATKLTPVRATLLYAKVLMESLKTDWSADPIELIAVSSTPHSPAYEHWFEAAIAAQHKEEAFLIADLTKRHRFMSALPLGGRLHELRWLLEGPEDILNQREALQRQDLFGRYPKFADLSRQIQQLRSQLKSEPLAPEASDAQQKQRERLKKLASLGEQQEIIVHEMALRRETMPRLFPPARDWKAVQKSLPKGTALWVFFATQRQFYAYMLNSEQYDFWQIKDSDKIVKNLGPLLKSIGNLQANVELGPQQLKDGSSLTLGRQMVEALLKDSRADLNEIPDEVVIVPDGPLWYLPFEALPVGKDDQTRPLIAKNRVRYLPFASLVVADRPPGRHFDEGQIAVMIGKLHPSQDAAIANEAFTSIKRFLPKADGFPLATYQPPAPPAVLASLFDGLIVLDEIEPPGEAALDWSPTQIERIKNGSTLADWFALPWGGPDRVLLPGLRTIAEASLKASKNGTPSGNEIFMSVSSLLANGSRTVLLSRWRVGGKSAHDLTREFAQELSHSSAADAWQRSVQLAREAPLEPAQEPRVKNIGEQEGLKTAHPFFWAGYMVIDYAGAPAREAVVVGRK
jgi:tetratricopeptide (TPR) repeat protein